MNPPPIFVRYRQATANFWNARNERERKQLLLAAVVAVLGLTYMLLIEPAYLGRQQLQKNLPSLRQQAAEFQTMSLQASALARETPPPAPPMTRESIEAALARAGLKPQNVAIAGTDLAKVQLSSVSFAGMVAWLDDMQKSARVTVADANITSQGQTDVVNASLTLRQQKSE
ncbi:type II secretion system protein GspM [Noviherbaspirillum sedimenti]|uniref:Type II secretion system protein M n=1 Tax=Noviherbaspirillum sedimenti TaxID=2320865 RepID=A0A3A3GR19_9BURK|nr:type II secretion system protein GspM [Noviherbaspirillum sedimenti]RJG03410.1 type II secretion system protein M [Noviherbaspirillum sedimenti]